MKIFNTEIDLKSFFKKGLPKLDDRFGVWFVTGRQGSGKNYYAVKLLLAQDKSTCACIYTNVRSLKIPGYKIKYFSRASELYFNTDEHCIFLIDEIARKWNKGSKTDDQFYAWLNQSRKRKRIVIMITQEWKELPMWLRRPAKYMISTHRNILSGFGIFTSTIADAENMVYNVDEGEYECPVLKKTIYKRNIEIAKLYDTFESINRL